MKSESKISIIIPCLNEEKAIGVCLDKTLKTVSLNNLNAEIIVVDNGSTDASVSIVKDYISKNQIINLVEENERGYGSAYLAGIKNSTGDIIVMADGDNTYDFSEIPEFISKIENEDLDLVVGNRFVRDNSLGEIMPFLNRWVGNPILSFLTKLFFKIKLNDIHCGIRAIKKESLNKIKLNTTGMEFASEMIVKAAKNNLKMTEIPVNYHERIGDSKLNPFVDGWRHLRFLFLYSPLYLFFIPGTILFFLGLVLLISQYLFAIPFFGINFYVHPIFIFSLMVIVGYQTIFFGAFAKIYAITHLNEKNKTIEKLFEYITIERAGIFSFILIIAGLALFLTILVSWISSDFGQLNEIKNSVVALTMIVVGIQTFFSSFMLSILSIKH